MAVLLVTLIENRRKNELHSFTIISNFTRGITVEILQKDQVFAQNLNTLHGFQQQLADFFTHSDSETTGFRPIALL